MLLHARSRSATGLKCLWLPIGHSQTLESYQHTTHHTGKGLESENRPNNESVQVLQLLSDLDSAGKQTTFKLVSISWIPSPFMPLVTIAILNLRSPRYVTPLIMQPKLLSRPHICRLYALTYRQTTFILSCMCQVSLCCFTHACVCFKLLWPFLLSSCFSSMYCCCPRVLISHCLHFYDLTCIL